MALTGMPLLRLHGPRGDSGRNHRQPASSPVSQAHAAPRGRWQINSLQGSLALAGLSGEDDVRRAVHGRRPGDAAPTAHPACAPAHTGPGAWRPAPTPPLGSSGRSPGLGSGEHTPLDGDPTACFFVRSLGHRSGSAWSWGALGGGASGNEGVGAGPRETERGGGASAWGRGLGKWSRWGAGPRPLWPLACGAPEQGFESARFSWPTAGGWSPDGRPSPCPRLSCLQPRPSLFTPLVTCSVAARVSGAWCRGSVGSGLQLRGPQLTPQALHPRPALSLEAWPAGCPQLQSWAASGEPPSAKETGPHGMSDVKPALEGPAQGHGAHGRQGARVLGSRRRACRLAGPGGLSVPVLEVWLTLPLSFGGTLKLPPFSLS